MNTKACLHCFSSTATVFDIENEQFFHESLGIRFIDCYTFVTGKQQCRGALCQMCMQQLKSAYVFKKKYPPPKDKVAAEQKPPTVDASQKNEDLERNLIEKALVKPVLQTPAVLPEIVSAGASKSNSDGSLLEHQCSLCKKLFGSTVNLNRHLKSFHTDNRPFKCALCEKDYKYSKGLKDHKYLAHPDVHPNPRKRHKDKTHDFQCNECGKLFHTTISAFKKHQATHEITMHKCKFCVRVFKLPIGLELHLQNEHQDKIEEPSTNLKVHSCSECGNKYRQAKELKVHMKVHSGDTKYKCKQCTAAFNLERSLKDHVKKRHASSDFKCGQCKEILKNQATLDLHVKLHTDQSQCVCLLCNIHFKCFNNLKEHHELKHRIYGTPYKLNGKNCQCRCGKLFTTLGNLRHHIAVLHLGEIYQCEAEGCEKVFRNSQSLFRHSFEHKDVAFPYMCAEATNCVYSSKNKFAFKQHLKQQHQVEFDQKLHGYDEERSVQLKKRHEEILKSGLPYKDMPRSRANAVYPYKCTQCPKSYKYSTGLHLHVKIKHKGFAIPCDECSKTFLSKKQLRSHQLEHKGVMPWLYKCPLSMCDFETNFQHHFKNHLLVHNITFDRSVHGNKGPDVDLETGE